MLEVETLERAEALDGLHEEWRELERSAALTHPFLGADWCRAWWRSFGDASGLRLVVARRSGALVGLLPLRLDRAPLVRRLPALRGRRLAPFQNGYSDRSGALLRPDAPEALAAMLRHLLVARRDWDFMDLRYLPAVELAACERALDEVGLAWERFASEPCFHLDLAESMKDFLAAQSGHFRKRLRENRLRLEKAGSFAVRRTGHELADPQRALEEFLAVDARSWRRETGTTIGGDPAASAFYRRIAADFAARAAFDLRLLDLDGRPIAGILCLHHGAAAFGLKTAYDAEFQRLAPGTFLLHSLIEDCHARGLRRFDFIRGDDGLRRRWTEAHEDFGRLVVFGRTPKGRVYSTLRMQIAPLMRRLAPRPPQTRSPAAGPAED